MIFTSLKNGCAINLATKMCSFGKKTEISLFWQINSIIFAHKIGVTIQIICENNVSQKSQFNCQNNIHSKRLSQ